MRWLIALIGLSAWLYWLNRRARRGDRRARLGLGLSLLVLGIAHLVLIALLYGDSGTLPIPGARGAPADTLRVDGDPVLLLLGALLGCGWPVLLIVLGVRELRRADAPTPPAAPRSPRRR